jgi:hypothetical protein
MAVASLIIAVTALVLAVRAARRARISAERRLADTLRRKLEDHDAEDPCF